MYYYKILNGSTPVFYFASEDDDPAELAEYPKIMYDYRPVDEYEYNAWAQERRDAEKQASMTNPVLRAQLDNALAANKLLEQQVTFLEDCLLEMADEVYA